MRTPLDATRLQAAQRIVSEALEMQPGPAMQKLYAVWQASDKAGADALVLCMIGEMVSSRALHNLRGIGEGR